MAVYKEPKTNTWRAVYRYKDWTGETRQTQKRGFATRRDALTWEREQMLYEQADLDMTFASFVDTYTVDMKNRIKENTWQTKEHFSASCLAHIADLGGGVFFQAIELNGVIENGAELIVERFKVHGGVFLAVFIVTLNHFILPSDNILRLNIFDFAF